MTYKEITTQFNNQFNTKVSKEAIRRRIGRGFVAWIPKYSEEQEEFLKDNLQVYTYAKVQKDFYDKFGMKITKQAITDRRRRVYGMAPVESFKKENYRVFWAESKIGDESKSSYRVLVKTGDKMRGGSSNWEYKHHLVWAEHHGEVPKGHRVLFLDGDINNFDIDNLACVPLHQVCILAANNWFSTEREFNLTALKYAELQIKLKE